MSHSVLLLSALSLLRVKPAESRWFRDWISSLFGDSRDSCPFSRTNIADDSCFVPDTLKGSLALSKSADGSLLAGTWQGAHESTEGNPRSFDTWPGSPSDNVWSVTKTSLGTELLGTPEGVKRKPAGQTDYTLNRVGDGAQGSFALLEDKIFVGTWEGLFMSQDDGLDWVKAPADCLPYNLSEDTSSGAPKPPGSAKYCEESVNHVEILPDGTLIAFYFGYGGAHKLIGTSNPLLESSWEPLPSYQDSEPCSSGFCLVQDAALFKGYLYVTFQSLAMVRLDYASAGAAWEIVPVDPSVENLDPMAVHVLDGALYLNTFQYGMYRTTNGTAWQKISTSGCDDIPLGGLGMVDTSYTNDGATVKGITFGTQFGPWFYRVS